jgi:hypothetical protein
MENHMPQVFYTNEAVIQMATELQAALANCTIDLFQDTLVPGITTTQLQLAAAVGNYSGYAQKTVAALLAPYLDPAGGASTNIATQQFQHNGGAVANMIGGAWVEDAGGIVRLVMVFDQPVPMAVATDAIPLDIIFNFRN